MAMGSKSYLKRGHYDGHGVDERMNLLRRDKRKDEYVVYEQVDEESCLKHGKKSETCRD